MKVINFDFFSIVPKAWYHAIWFIKKSKKKKKKKKKMHRLENIHLKDVTTIVIAVGTIIINIRTKSIIS